VDVPVVVQPVEAVKKVKPELTAEQRAIESKKRADRRMALKQRKRDAAALEERQRAAKQLQLLQTEAKAKAMQEHDMLFYGHTTLT
jgi:U3 small nucleolar RNA-associated protein 14